MWAQLARYFEEEVKLLARVLAAAVRLLGAGVRAVWGVLRPPLVFLLNLLLALLLLFEEWGWRPLSNLLARLARFPLWATIELWIAGLPPYGALVSLVVPSAIIIPAKLLGVYFLATGHFVLAAAVIVTAKIIGTGLVARIFVLTKPALMQIAWVRTAYEAFVPWQEALFARVRSSWIWRTASLLRRRANTYVRRSWIALRPTFQALWRRALPKVPAAPRPRRRARPIAAEARQPPPGTPR